MPEVSQQSGRRRAIERAEGGEAEERFRAVHELSPDGFMTFVSLRDPGGSIVDFVWTYVNDAAARIVGRPKELLVGRRLLEEMPGNRDAGLFDAYVRVVETGEALHRELGYTGEGLALFVRLSAARAGDGFAVVFVDQSERKRAEAANARRSEQLRRLAQAATKINAVRDIVSVTRLVTEEARALIGAHQAVTSTTTNQDWAQAIESVSLSEKYAPWRDYIRRPDGTGIYALVCRTNTPLRLTQAELEAHAAWRGFGAQRSEHPPMRGWLAVPLVGRDGQNLGLIQLSDKEGGEFNEDDEAMLVQLAQMASIAIENQRLYEQEQRARAQAEEASRLKDEFLATVSHELRTPLTAFLGYAQLLRVRKRDEAYIATTVERMVQSARAQAQLIDDLLDIARIVSGKLRIEPQPTDLAAVIHAALDTVRPAAQAKAIRLHVDLDERARRIAGDPNRLQQVVWNLLSNAVKFTPRRGEVAVRLERQGDTVRLVVSDTGQGIRPEFLPFVFDRFRQADSTSTRPHGGLGLGLAIVRHLTELHGGSVRAESAGEGAGTTFTVELPARAGDAWAAGALTAAALAPTAAAATELGGLRVLLVDDQPEILELLEEVFVASGCAVRTAPGARAGLEALRSWRPDVLVSDIAMPGEDGYWLIRHVRALGPDEGGATPAVALTAYVRVEDRMRVLGAGFQLYVPKPVEPAELRDVVARVARTTMAE